MSNELTIFRGDNADIECAVTDKDGAVVNITGASISFTVRDMQDDTQQFQCTTAVRMSSSRTELVGCARLVSFLLIPSQ